MAFGALLCACVMVLCSAAPFKLPQRIEPENDRPIIGILTQEVEDYMKKFGKTYIPSSYVKYIESGGARVVPIRLNQSSAEHEKIFKSINGLLLIGGSVNLETSDFAHTAGIYFRLALKANDEGDYFPIWGTCLGFQLLTVLVAGENLLSKTTAENVAYPLNFTSVLSTNIAENGLEFVSTMEGKKYPFYGVQWHPEVNRFQWDPHHNFPHSSNAVRVSSLLAEFFVNEGRKSSHHFSDAAEESSALIYNYNPVYMANVSAYEQSYFF
ncbi:Gamma-glutamyl hydrolase [Labeo rohita]|uniref:folate gamma-glutamyl hydrolase n=1 Tax=Labeo rohita TaxID=84645 RepID=A0ABQ8MHL4_LABRO|nr:Gamma-glutamyl hydrolase [Labeo rohita]